MITLLNTLLGQVVSLIVLGQLLLVSGDLGVFERVQGRPAAIALVSGCMRSEVRSPFDILIRRRGGPMKQLETSHRMTCCTGDEVRSFSVPGTINIIMIPARGPQTVFPSIIVVEIIVVGIAVVGIIVGGDK